MIAVVSKLRERTLRAWMFVAGAGAGRTLWLVVGGLLVSRLIRSRTGQVASGAVFARSRAVNHARRRPRRVPHGAMVYPRMVRPASAWAVLVDHAISVFAFTAISVARVRHSESSSVAVSSSCFVGTSWIATASDCGRRWVARVSVCGVRPGAVARADGIQHAMPLPKRPSPRGRKSAAISGRLWVARVIRWTVKDWLVIVGPADWWLQ